MVIYSFVLLLHVRLQTGDVFLAGLHCSRSPSFQREDSSIVRGARGKRLSLTSFSFLLGDVQTRSRLELVNGILLERLEGRE